MSKPMKLCFYIRVPERRDQAFEKQIGLAKELGYWGIEPEVRDPADIDPDYIKKVFDDNGLGMSAIATGPGKVIDGLSLTDQTPKVRWAAVERLKAQIDLGKRWALPVIIGSMRGTVPPGLDRSVFLKWLNDGLAQLCGELAPGQKIFLEAINRYETTIANSAVETVEVAKRTGSEQVQVLLDSFHMNIEEKSMTQSLRDTGPRLGHFHFSDSNRCALGTGHIDYAELAGALADMGYDGCVTVEVLKKPDLETSMRLSMEHIRKIGLAIA
jgi:sugar phosphate isomerase/epimerase